MPGTDHSATPISGPAPAIVLVRPQMGENIGAAARAMWNFGLDRMRIVSPRDGWPNERAVAMASGAARVLDNVVLADSLEEAVGDMHHVYATTARPRDLEKAVMTPEQAMLDAHARIAAGQKVGILFGPERAGLENADVVLAHTVITVPVNPAFGSLNLAQCVLLVSYEWVRATGTTVEAHPGTPAIAEEVHHLLRALEDRLDVAKYYYPPDRAASMRENLRNLINRLDLTDADVRTLHGVFRALADRHPVRKS
ncbi:RNA methyltransferase [Halovulum sp. GXIMD14793]